MTSSQIIYFSIWVMIIICALTAIGIAFKLDRNKIKEIDILVHGFEIPEDSIFYYGMRLMNYGGAFAWRFGVKRSKLLYLRDNFDKDFQRPFKIYFYLMVGGGSGIFILYGLDKLLLHVT